MRKQVRSTLVLGSSVLALLGLGMGCSLDLGNTQESPLLRKPAREAVKLPELLQPSRGRQLISKTDGDERAATETCADSRSGNQVCTWDDAMGTLCEYEIDADGVLLWQNCQGDWGSYNCSNDFTSITCVYTDAGDSCTEQWSQDYELLESSCDWTDYMTDEDCNEQEDGSVLCQWSDGYTTCTISYDANGNFISQLCGDEYYSYNCAVAQDNIECTLYIEGEPMCEDSWTLEGEPVTIGCEEYFGEPTDPDDPRVPTDPSQDCVEQSDGTWLCTYADDYQSCTYVVNASGDMMLSQSCTDGTYRYDCVGDANQVTCLLYIEDELLCQDTYTQEGEPLELGCEEFVPSDEPSDPTEPCDSCECPEGERCH